MLSEVGMVLFSAYSQIGGVVMDFIISQLKHLNSAFCSTSFPPQGSLPEILKYN